MESLWLVGRVIFGIYFIYMGLNHFIKFTGMKQYAQYKELPVPGVTVIVSGLMLLAGALSILTGYWIQVGVLLLVIFLVAAAFLMHNFWKVTDPQAKAGETAHFYKNLGLAGACLMMLVISDWSWTL